MRSVTANLARESSPPWLVRYRPGLHERLRLFCLPHAGTGASQFRAWQSQVPLDVAVYGVQLPGRESRLRERSYTRLSALVAALADVMSPHLDVPFALFGHSMGAWICFELARELRRRYDAAPVHLFVSGRRAPHLPSQHSALHRLSDADFVQALVQRYGGIPEMVLRDPELLQLFLPILRADLTLVETYQYAHEPPLDCPLTVFGGANDATVGPAELAAWSDETGGPFALRMLPGDHFFVQSAREAVLCTISAHLRRSMATRPSGAEADSMLAAFRPQHDAAPRPRVPGEI
jgi:surfactin synthase thioesterase subunit